MRYSVLVVTIVCLCNYMLQDADGRGCAQIPNAEKLDCGFKSVDRLQCLDRGCCWIPCRDCDKSIPWCFYSEESETDECAVPFEEKEDCGHYGIKKDECIERDCCWKPSKLPNEPWCFNRKAEILTTRSTQLGNEGQVRLVNPSGDTTGGRVEIYHDGQWGTVCDDEFDINAARVVCRQLSLFDGYALSDAKFGRGEGPVWLDEVRCDGDEESLSECDHDGWNEHNCSHSEDVSVQCEETEVEGSGSGLNDDEDM